MFIPFEQLPDSSRIWLYASSRNFTTEEEQLIRKVLVDFCDVWNSHGKAMHASFEILHHQLLVLAVDQSELGASGCSIDSSVRALHELERRLNTNLVDQGKITLRDKEGRVRVVSALGIKSKINAGEITAELEVVRASLHTKADLQQLWQPVLNSWMSKYFPN
ncbi:MAG: hypothetical protein RL407_700 [Bacteroidota bacterium]|jgi:hypothetical protein